MNEKRFWDFPTLGELDVTQRATFYDEIADDMEGENLFGFGDSRFFENPTLRVGVLQSDRTVVPATQACAATIGNTKINVYMEKYFVHDMPGNRFDLQIMIGARHHFDDRDEPDEIAHTLAVKGVRRDYVNYLSEPVFRNLAIEEVLSLYVAVNFVGDKSTNAFLAFMDNDAVKKGLQLVNIYNPVFGAAVGYVRSIAGGLLSARKNQAITNMNLSFVRSPGPASMPLVEGTYLLVQPLRDEQELDFSRIVFDASVDRFKVGDQLLDRNHMVLRIEAVS